MAATSLSACRKTPPDLRHVERGGFGDLAGRRDRISIEGAASGEDRALHDRFVALHQLLAHASASFRCLAACAWRTRAIKAQNRDGARLGTGDEADAASRAACARVGRGAIAVVIQAFAQRDHLGRTCLDAQAAALAFVRVHPDQPSIQTSLVLYPNTHRSPLSRVPVELVFSKRAGLPARKFTSEPDVSSVFGGKERSDNRHRVNGRQKMKYWNGLRCDFESFAGVQT